MKKLLAVVGLFLLSVLFLVKEAKADGNYTPALVVSTVTGQGYSYPAYPQGTATTPIGGVLVTNGSLFNWSNATVSSTSTSTSQQFPGLTSLTLTQIQGASGLIPATTGQLVMCSNCTSSFVCLSSGSVNAYQWVALSSSTATGMTVCK